MIQCPNCKHQELPGALFCSECGTQLVTADTLTSPLANQSAESLGFDSQESNPAVMPAAGPFIPVKNIVISLHVVNADRTLHLTGRSEYSLGRIARGQPILPDFDLSEFDAYDHGVSRLHAAIKVSALRISIMDLGSANGTRINGQKLVPNVEYPLKNGDLIALGKLKIEFQTSND
jgi:pSer/pThr/pTyr-binding forkhead associated (FHA) protein